MAFGKGCGFEKRVGIWHVIPAWKTRFGQAREAGWREVCLDPACLPLPAMHSARMGSTGTPRPPNRMQASMAKLHHQLLSSRQGSPRLCGCWMLDAGCWMLNCCKSLSHVAHHARRIRIAAARPRRDVFGASLQQMPTARGRARHRDDISSLTILLATSWSSKRYIMSESHILSPALFIVAS
jgi:hypothetical protein